MIIMLLLLMYFAFFAAAAAPDNKKAPSQFTHLSHEALAGIPPCGLHTEQLTCLGACDTHCGPLHKSSLEHLCSNMLHTTAAYGRAPSCELVLQDGY